MMNLKNLSIIFIIFVFLSLIFFPRINNICVKAETLHVGKNGYAFSSINSAIKKANFSDTIYVHKGTYNESIVLYKKINLIGEEGAVLEFVGKNDIISIKADNCTLEGFIIRNCTNDSFSGINIESHANTIKNNVVSNNSGWGLYMYNSDSNVIVNNTFINDGICIVGNRNNWESYTIKNNTVNNRPLIFYKNLKNIDIIGIDAGQIILANCSYCNVTKNEINGGDQGLVLGYSNYNTIDNNQVSNTKFGLRLQYSNNNSVIMNNFTNNEYGIYVTHSFHNQIFNNNVTSSVLYGCWLCCNSKFNEIFKNNFTLNSISAYDIFENNWSKYCIGNYWDDYNGSDVNNDGIGDSPYFISPKGSLTKDLYPIVDYYKINKCDNKSGTSGLSFFIIFLTIILFLLLIKKSGNSIK